MNWAGFSVFVGFALLAIHIGPIAIAVFAAFCIWLWRCS